MISKVRILSLTPWILVTKLMTVNPEDVESVTVLKGASATALYGSRAANGVIMVTTKRAGAEKLSVTYDGSFMGSSVLRVPQTQDRFGQGMGIFRNLWRMVLGDRFWMVVIISGDLTQTAQKVY